jgi:hypothetical protein
MRAKHPTAAAPASPLLRLTSPYPAAPSERGSYTAAETIMRSPVHPKRAERPDPRTAAPTEAAR